MTEATETMNTTKMDWSDGYFSGVSYPLEFYRQTMPSWLAAATILTGHRPPDLTKPFRWCDLGCGPGFTALAAAACHPDGEFFAVDFNPAHIETGRRLAAAAGIENIRFIEAAFAELEGSKLYEEMDFIVLHGIWSWVSSEQRRNLLRFVRANLAPGGIVYIGYNGLAGWAALLPVQRLLRYLSRAAPGPVEQIVARAMALIGQMTEQNAEFFRLNPVVAQRLEFLGRQDVRYLAHELLHDDWAPTSFDEVAADFASAKCGYIGSAALLENLDVFAAPRPLAGLLAGERDPVLREIMRDFGAGRMFRRDLFRRGTEPPPRGLWLAELDALVLAACGREELTEIRIQGFGEGLLMRPDVYGPVLQGLRAGPLRWGELRELWSDTDLLREIASVLMAAGIAHPVIEPSPAALRATAALNRAIMAHNAAGGALPYLVSPVFSSALASEPVEIALAEAVLTEGEDMGRIVAKLCRTGPALFRDGTEILDPAARADGWASLAREFWAGRVGVFRRGGIF